MRKICSTCGKERFMNSWESKCYQCRTEEHRREIVDQITSGEIIETDCEDEIFCPHCGCVYGIDEQYDLYDEGDHDLQCPERENDFVVYTVVSYSYDTSRKEQPHDTDTAKQSP